MKPLTSDQYLHGKRFFNNIFSRTKSTPTRNGIVARIIREAKDENRKNIDDWKRAITAAQNPESPRWYLLHDTYDKLMRDGHLMSTIQTRELATLSTRFAIYDKKSGNEIPEKTELLWSSWFINLLKDAIRTETSGYRIIELVNPDTMEFKLIPPRNVVPQKGLVLFEANGDEGILYESPEFADRLIQVGRKGDFGIINDIIPQLIWKRNAQQAWAEYSEKYGIPMMVATTNTSDDVSLRKIKSEMQQLGENLGALLPVGTELEIKDGANAGNINVFLKQIGCANDEVSKRFLGGTMVADNGSSRSQSEVHERTLDNKIAASDRMNLEFLVNDQVLPLLSKWGLPFTENDRFKFDTKKKTDLDKFWLIVKDVLEDYEVPEEWITKTFNIPIQGKKKKTEKDKGASANFKLPLPDGRVEAILNFPDYPESKSTNTVTASGDSVIKKLQEQSEAILKSLWGKKDTDAIVLLKSLISGTWLQDGLFTGWGKRRLDSGYDATDHVALAFMEYNLFHFSHTRELATLQQLNQLLIDKDKLAIRSFSDFKQMATPLLDKVNVHWLKTERNFTVAAAQNASAFQQHWNERDTITPYIQYQTAGDGQVRKSHQALDGKVFRIDDAEARRLYPPIEHGCRCEFVQHVGEPDEITSGADAIKNLNLDKDKASVMLQNRGELKEVFLSNQHYIKSKWSDYASHINQLNYSSYGLQKIADINGKSLKLDESLTESKVKKMFKPEKGKSFMGFKDAQERKMILEKADFEANLSKGFKLFPHVEEALNKADEIYMTSSKKGQVEMRYVKKYKGESMVVDTVVGDKVQVKSWYTSKEDKIRTGLLINKY